jgi:crotonobetainyl-CoA:carnitine CoA-transferase CaiB-like acyl-CoA transferase
VEADLVTGLLDEVGLPAHLADRVAVVGDERPFATPFPVVECAASVLASIGAAASLLWEDRTGEPQRVTVGRGHAGASLVGFAFQQLDPAAGATPAAPSSLNRPLVKLYPCRDGRWVHLHGQFPQLAARTCEVLGCDVDSPTDVVADRVARWDGLALEDALADAGTCGAMARTKDEWSAHPQSVAIAPFGRVSIERIGDSPPEPLGLGLGRHPRRAAAGRATRPLDGVRVLDLSRLLAGPTNGRTLAEHGADVLLVNSPRLDNIPAFVMDTSHGKRSCCVELDDPGGVATLRALAAEADVFTQGYRGGSLERRGFGPGDLAELRPGIVVVTINCYGDAGPWRLRPGWEQMAQTVSGLAVGQGGSDHPTLVPAAACDYTTGYLAALGTMAALWRRTVEGGSYHVRASLCQTATWFAGAPTVSGEPNGFGDVDSFLTSSDTPFGRLRHLAPVARMAATPARWEVPTSPIGTHRAAWLPADDGAVTI